MFVGEGREILAARRELVGHSLAGEGFDQRIGREARFALLAVADQRRAGGFQAADGVRAGRVLFGDEGVVGDAVGIIFEDRMLEPRRARKRADLLGGNGPIFQPSGNALKRAAGGNCQPYQSQGRVADAALTRRAALLGCPLLPS